MPWLTGGADHSVMSARAAKRLGFWTKDGGQKYSVKGHGGNSSIYDARSFSVQLLNPEGRKVREVRVKSYADPCGDLKVENWKELKMNWPHLRRLDIPAPTADSVVDFILGSSGLDLMEAIRPVHFGPAGGPVAKFTALGWVVGGKTCPSSDSDSDESEDSDDEGRLNFSSGGIVEHGRSHRGYEAELDWIREEHRQREDRLKEDVKLLWGYGNKCCRKALRNADSPAVESAWDTQAREQLAASARSLPDGASEIGLLWKDHRRPRWNSRTGPQHLSEVRKTHETT